MNGEQSQKLKRDKENRAEDRQVFSRAEELMRVNKLYRQQRLTLDAMAAQMGILLTTLSRAINKGTTTTLRSRIFFSKWNFRAARRFTMP